MPIDLDHAELHLSVRDFFTKAPYITADGQTSLDMPYESIEIDDRMYEGRQQQLSTARIKLPSLLAFPELRPLLQQLKEGNRVELFNFQPDVGDPVFAGFIPPGGITEEGGNVILDVADTLTQLRWQHVRRFEYFNTNVAGLYNRALSGWQDWVVEDFASGHQTSIDWLRTSKETSGYVDTLADGYLRLTCQGTATAERWIPNNGPGAGFTIQAGDAFLFEADITLYTAFGPGAYCQVMVMAESTSSNSYFSSVFIADLNNASLPRVRCDADEETIDNVQHWAPQAGTVITPSMPARHQLTCYAKVSADGSTMTIYTFLDNVNVSIAVAPWIVSNQTYQVKMYLQANNSGDYAQFNFFRARHVSPILGQASRFNPQTTDIMTYQPNNEENLQFLQFVAEKDNAEYRPNYKPWPAMDELELDAVGTLGKNASAVLGYEQPGASPSAGSPQTSPIAVVTDQASYLTAPPFRFEEGYNLAAPPRILTPANVHANDVIRMGASSMESQVFGEAISVAEIGRPQSGSGPLFPGVYPDFEQITNDDRVGLNSLAKTMAQYELNRRTDTTPSLELEVVAELPYTGRWRAGDSAYVITRSLRNNVEQTMRVMEVRHTAGSPKKVITLGKMDFDPELRRMYGEALSQQWLYDQTGSSPTELVYPFPNVAINAGAASSDFTFSLDQLTTGTQIIKVVVRWYADANVLNLQPVINTDGVYIAPGQTSPSATDSGDFPVTQYFQLPGQYKLHFVNNDSATRTLAAAFLVIQVKAGS